MLAEAAWNDKWVEFSYRRWNDTVKRRVMPLGLVLKAGVWYLVAQVKDQPRTYKVANIGQPVVREDRFARPKDFDLARFWTVASQAYESSLYLGKAELRISPLGLRKLESLGAAVAQAAADTATEPDPNGWVGVTIPIETVEQAARELMRLGSDVEVLAPPEVRRRIRQTAQGLLRLYRTRGKRPLARG
jgi:predicted DNA-binding transcriptional regulator YafY